MYQIKPTKIHTAVYNNENMVSFEIGLTKNYTEKNSLSVLARTAKCLIQLLMKRSKCMYVIKMLLATFLAISHEKMHGSTVILIKKMRRSYKH